MPAGPSTTNLDSMIDYYYRHTSEMITVEWDGTSQLYRGPSRPKKNDLEKLHMWIDKEGGEMPIKELGTAHLLNIVAMLYRKEGKKNFQRHKLVTLEKELVKRLQEVINA